MDFRGTPLVAALVLACLFLLLARCLLRSISWGAREKGRPLPPGPQGLPIIGNLFDMPQSKAWRGLRDLSCLYGQCCSVAQS